MTRLPALCAAMVTSFALAAGVSAQSGVDQTRANNSVRAELAKQGDDGLVPRPASHWGYSFAAKHTSRAQIRRALRKMGFVVENAAADGGVVFSHTTSVSGAEFDRLTAELTAVLIENGWEYDGWETVLVRKGE